MLQRGIGRAEHPCCTACAARIMNRPRFNTFPFELQSNHVLGTVERTPRKVFFRITKTISCVSAEISEL